MVGGSYLRIPLLCRLLDSIDQRLPSREKLLHLRYSPILGTMAGYLLTIIQAHAIRIST